VVYDGIRLDVGYRIDMVVENAVIVEIKACDAITAVHQAQLMSYLKLSGKTLGLLINFHVAHLKNGIKRIVNGTGWE
jgi:GxxExxY protein